MKLVLLFALLFAPPNEFERKVHAFAASYNALVAELNGGVANTKHFEQTSKLFHEMESDPGWLKRK